MIEKDPLGMLKPLEIMPPLVTDADNTPAAIDMLGYSSALILIHVGIGGITFTSSNKVEFKLTHSDDDSTYVAVTDADVSGVTTASGGIVKSLVAAHAAASLTAVAYKGGKRYLKLLADFSGTHSTGTPMAATIIKMGATTLPVV